MSNETQIIIRSTSDLRRFLCTWRWIGSREAISLQLPLFEARLQSSTEKRLNFWRKVCGCQVGALLLLITLALRVPSMLRTSQWTWRSLATEAGIALLAALSGKVLAVTAAHLLLAGDAVLLLRRAYRMSQQAGGG